MKFSLLNRKIHYWGSITIAAQLFIVLITGVLLLLKKEIEWIQPPTVKGEKKGVAADFDRILEVARTVPEAEIFTWSDIDRLDVRPGKGMLKVRSNNRWEIQINAHSGDVLHVAYRRSDLIESIHDGSFFGDYCKLWIFLPSATVVIVLWVTGMYLFFYPYYIKAKRRRREQRQTIFAKDFQ
ncbi:MAG: PepSY-associated TM helix domain-containing protein [Desulfobacteraceae bacterium]|jgi:uncharacterized iron-regulated membrane protein